MHTSPSTSIEEATGDLPTANCAYCRTPVAFQYCPNCGQKRSQGRLQLRHLATDFMHQYFETDSGVFFTLRQMLLRPGHAVNEFLAGKRKPYLKPVQFYLLLLTLFFLVSEVLEVGLLDMNSEMGYQPSPEVAKKKSFQETMEILTQNMRVILTVSLFFMALTLKMMYRKYAYTVTELLVFSLYIFGVSYLFLIVQTVLFYLNISPLINKVVVYGNLLLSTLYLTYAIRQLYTQRGFYSWVKAFFACVITTVFYSVFAAFIGAGISFWQALLHK